MNISIAAETLFSVGGFPITNSLLLSVFAFIFAAIFLVFVGRKIAKKSDLVYEKWAKNSAPKKSKFAKNLNGNLTKNEAELDETDHEILLERSVEKEVFRKNGFFTRLAFWAIEGLYNTVKQVVPDAKFAKKVAPFTISIFFFVLFNYYFGILPVVGEAIFATVNGHEIPLFRGGAADLNFTFMLAILTIVMVQVYSVKALGFRGSLSRFFVAPWEDFIGFFGGLLELVGEFSRMLALSFRLFGNCVAGEILLIVALFLAKNASFAILPFLYIFELFIGGIQAYIFFMLASTFIGLAVSHTSSDHSAEKISRLDETV